LSQSCGAQKSGAVTEKAKAEGVMKIADYIAGKDYDQYGVATFAGGCFWCTEASFERIQGVVDVISGYAGGEEQYPGYYQVASSKTGHAESIQIYYDREVITFDKLLEVFFVAHDPTTLNRQGPDVGPQYRSEIFYHGEAQKKAAEAYIARLENEKVFKKPIVTKLSAYEQFWTAEEYHQDFYERNPTQSYVMAVSRPKVKKVEKTFKDILKEEYK
jgi:peptide-methionine (S)-S-oxide reductase